MAGSWRGRRLDQHERCWLVADWVEFHADWCHFEVFGLGCLLGWAVCCFWWGGLESTALHLGVASGCLHCRDSVVPVSEAMHSNARNFNAELDCYMSLWEFQ